MTARTPAPSRPLARRAFTLVELMVVVAIIAALLAILLPSMGKAVGYAESVNCQSNMRQIVIATISYSADSYRALPHPNWGTTGGSTPGWLYADPNYTLQEHVKTGALWKYLQTEAVYHCPSHAKPWGDAGSTEALTSYCMNGSVVQYGAKSDGTFRLGDYRGEDILFWEQDENSGYWNDGSNFPNEQITPRHTLAGLRGAGNVAMQDGSVEWIALDDFNSEALPHKPAQRTRLWNTPFTTTGW